MNDYTTKTERPWGHFRMLDKGPGFVAKAFLVKGEQRLSLQRHAHRAERWTVAMGNAIATVNGVKTALAPGDSIFIPLGAAHRVANPAKEPLVIIELWIGDDLREDDIVRLEDDYGRAELRTGGVIAASADPVMIGDGTVEHIIPLADVKVGDTIKLEAGEIKLVMRPIADVQAEIEETARRMRERDELRPELHHPGGRND